MFNAEIPTRAELPAAAQLVKSTVIAAAAAALILVTAVLPAEYAIDPTGIGRVLGLTQMGEIKKQLAIEAELDRQRDRLPAPAPDRRSSLPSLLGALLVSPSLAHSIHGEDQGEAAMAGVSPPILLSQLPPAAASKQDEIVFTLRPNEGVEYKMTMLRGGVVQYSWSVEGGKVNYDLHGSPKDGGRESSYKRDREVVRDDGTLTAAYDGWHGWFWRNRGSGPVTVTLKVSGAYTEIKRLH